MKPAQKTWLIICGIFVGAFLFVVALNPLRWPNWALYKWILRNNPIGSTIQQLQATGAAKGWKVYDPQIANHVTATMLNLGCQPGEKYVIVHHGYYYSILRTDVESIWIFDSNDCLSKVQIRRGCDAP